MHMRVAILLVLFLAACSKPSDESNFTAPAVTKKQGLLGNYNGCALLSPKEIAAALGGTVSQGVPEPPGSLCRYKLNGDTKFGHAVDREIEVTRASVYFQDRTSPSSKGIPMIDVPELGPDAYFQGIGTLWSKAPDGSTILIHIDYNLFGATTKATLAAKDAFVQLGKTAASHAT
jgi:hypothetical protein